MSWDSEKRLSEVSQYQKVKYRYRISFHSTLVGVCEGIRTGDLGGFRPSITTRGRLHLTFDRNKEEAQKNLDRRAA